MKNKICTKCRKEKSRNDHSWCSSCKSKQLREKRHTYKPEDRIKKRARWVAWWHQKQGNILPQPCEKCGKEESVKHHDDYSKPLEIRWLCVRCHNDYHKQERQKESA